MNRWGQPSKGRSNDGSVISVQEATTERNSVIKTALDSPFALETVKRTKELLDFQGWCLWQCNMLDGGTVAVVRDELVEGVPQGYPVYTEAELEELFEDDISEATIRLVHEAKKLAGAKVTTEVTNL